VITPRLFESAPVAVQIRGLPAGWRLIRFGPATEDTWFADVSDRKGRDRTGRGITVTAALIDALTRANSYYLPSDEDASATMRDWRICQEPGVSAWSVIEQAPKDRMWILAAGDDNAQAPVVVRWKDGAWRGANGKEVFGLVRWAEIPAYSNAAVGDE
jgi:hypothetical protein